MSRPVYTYHAAAAPAALPLPRQPANHGTSSAFSASANPDEDWTQISDLAERRRIQNRIAQRNYRKKLKRRLEDLERRAASPSASPPPASPAPRTHKPAAPTAAAARAYTPPAYTTPPADDDLFPASSAFSDRDGSLTPPLFAYSPYPPPAAAPDCLYPGYNYAYPYRPEEFAYAPNYLAPPPVLQGHQQQQHGQHGQQQGKREEGLGMDAFGLSFAAMAGLDVGYEEGGDPHTPPMCHSFDLHHHHQDAYAHVQFPGSPMSLPPSPRLGL